MIPEALTTGSVVAPAATSAESRVETFRVSAQKVTEFALAAVTFCWAPAGGGVGQPRSGHPYPAILRSSSISIAARAACCASAWFSPRRNMVLLVSWTPRTADMTSPRMAIVISNSVSVKPRSSRRRAFGAFMDRHPPRRLDRDGRRAPGLARHPQGSRLDGDSELIEDRVRARDESHRDVVGEGEETVRSGARAGPGRAGARRVLEEPVAPSGRLDTDGLAGRHRHELRAIEAALELSRRVPDRGAGHVRQNQGDGDEGSDPQDGHDHEKLRHRVAGLQSGDEPTHLEHVLPHWCRGVSPFVPGVRMAPQGHPHRAPYPAVFFEQAVCRRLWLHDFQNLSTARPISHLPFGHFCLHFVSPRAVTARGSCTRARSRVRATAPAAAESANTAAKPSASARRPAVSGAPSATGAISVVPRPT